jgi:sulfur transfer protein SufE
LLLNKSREDISLSTNKQTASMPHEQAILKASNWPEKHRQLLLLSKALPLLPIEQRTQGNEVKGCEARVWLELDEANHALLAYSDSKVVRGILALILLKQMQIKDKPTQPTETEVVKDEFDYESYLQSLGLSDYFSAGRKDGIRIILQRLKLIYSA